MELLAPAGNLDKLKTAVLYGANAVYLAGQKFSLRGASDNFSETELLEGVLLRVKTTAKHMLR
jgi:putative protease